MRVFVFEYLSSGAMAGQSGTASLQVEGWAMLSAILADLQQCPGIETVTLLARQLSARGSVVHASPIEHQEVAFRSLVRSTDRTLVVAPETGRILETRCRWVEEEQGRLLGPSSSAVALTADKLALAQHLASCGVPTPLSRVAAATADCPFPYPVVVKPRDGAGSLATFRINTQDDWQRARNALAAEEWTGDLIVQPCLAGKSVSVAVLIGPGATLALAPAEQHLSGDGRLRYLGGSLPLPQSEAQRATRLATRAVATISGMNGFVGVDLVLSDDDDGRGDAVIEINPRLTTSYIGLRKLARFNLASALLAVENGSFAPALEWAPGPVRWLANGTVDGG